MALPQLTPSGGTQPRDPEPWIGEPASDVSHEGGAIFRTVCGADGRVEHLQLPPTRENLLDVRLEDKVTQTNPHARVLSPLAVALRTELEEREEGPRYGVFEDLLVLLERHPGFRHDTSPDVMVCTGLEESPERVGGSLDVLAKGYEIPLVIEVVSTTYMAQRAKDEVDNVPVYDRLGVADYVMVYPKIEERGEPLQVVGMTRGLRGDLVVNPPDRRGRIRIDSLGLWIFVDEKGRLALQDIRTGHRIWFHVDEKRLRLAAEHRAEEEARRAEAEAEGRREAERRAEKSDRRAEDARRLAAEALVLVLESRGLVLTGDDRSRIFACRDVDTLRRWTRAAVHAGTAADLWDAP